MAGARGGTLVLSHQPRSIDISEALAQLAADADTTLVVLNKRQVRWLPWTLWRLGAARYRKVLIDLPFKMIRRRAATLARLPEVVFYEEDACQDRIATSKWRGQFAAFYRRVRPSLVIVTGQATARHFTDRGVPARAVPKGYASDRSGLLGLERDIRVGFVGRMKSGAYHERSRLIDAAVGRLGCEVVRAEGARRYRETLNRIRFFFSADKGLGEYMAKNFEAMACGCILVAYRQGDGEEEFLGLRDMENCILYSDIEEAAEKIDRVSADPGLEQRIAANAQRVIGDFSHRAMGRRIAELLDLP